MKRTKYPSSVVIFFVIFSIFGFGFIWYIWWLVVLSVLGIFACLIGRLWTVETEFEISAQEVAAIEGRKNQ